MNYRIIGLSPEPFKPLYGRSDLELAAKGVTRYVVDEDSGFPDRIELRDAAIGETVLLLNHVSQPANTPFRASHAIFVREGADQTYDRINEIPEVMRGRLLSIRAFDSAGMMLDADVVDGQHAEETIVRLLQPTAAAYLHVHNARRGCYSCRVERCR
jgi:hypothetical protein